MSKARDTRCDGCNMPSAQIQTYEGAAANACLDYYSLDHGINNYCGLVFVCM